MSEHCKCFFFLSFFSPFLALQYSNFWIGASDINVEGEWVWVSDQSNIQFDDWRWSEPNNYDMAEDCGCINLNQEVFQKQWADERCNRMYLYICEI